MNDENTVSLFVPQFSHQLKWAKKNSSVSDCDCESDTIRRYSNPCTSLCPPSSQGSERGVIESSDVGCEEAEGKSRKIANLSEWGNAKAVEIFPNLQTSQRITKVYVLVFEDHSLKTRSYLIDGLLNILFCDLAISMICWVWESWSEDFYRWVVYYRWHRWTRQTPLSTLPFSSGTRFKSCHFRLAWESFPVLFTLPILS